MNKNVEKTVNVLRKAACVAVVIPGTIAVSALAIAQDAVVSIGKNVLDTGKFVVELTTEIIKTDLSTKKEEG